MGSSSSFYRIGFELILTRKAVLDVFYLSFEIRSGGKQQGISFEREKIAISGTIPWSFARSFAR
jgi:hypothetical protein